MRGWQSPVVAFDPNHAPMANPPMIRLDSPGIAPVVYRVKRKIGAAERNQGMHKPQDRPPPSGQHQKPR